MDRVWRGTRMFFSRAALWTVVLMAVPGFVQILTHPLDGDRVSLEWLYLISSWVGLFLPFAAFAGGIAGQRLQTARGLGVSAGLVSVLSLFLLGFASPQLHYQADTMMGLDVGQLYPMGPVTLGGLSDLRDRIEENPPDEFSFGVDRPLASPPNWLTYRIHTPLVLSVFAILAAFLGALTASLTSGLSPPARKNARWATGLLSGVLFFFAETMGGEWVRGSPLNSGAVGAWGPLLLPAIQLWLFALLRSRRRSTVSERNSSDG